MKEIKIGKKTIGSGHPVYIIAEAGSNHNCDLKTALKLIDVAVEAKADAVKFQLFRAEKLYPKKAQSAKFLADRYKNIHDLIKSMEMPPEWVPKLVRYCRQKGLDFLCTPFDEQSVDILEKAGIIAFKVASSECNDVNLIEHIAKKKKPIILSTALCTAGDIEETVGVIRRHHNEIILMHNIMNYPAQIEDTNLMFAKYLGEIFNCPFGLSDHSLDPIILPVALTAIGGNIIEKHFTLDKKLIGPDHSYALEPQELKQMVLSIRQTEAALRFRENRILKSEEELIEVSKRSIQAARHIKKGEKLSSNNIVIIRPGKLGRGLEPRYYNVILGKKINENIKEGEGILWRHLLN